MKIVPIIPETTNIDGVEYKLPQWLEIGHSVFLPCCDWQRVFEIVSRHYAPCGWKLKARERVERDYLGVRVWRVA